MDRASITDRTERWTLMEHVDIVLLQQNKILNELFNFWQLFFF